MRLLGALMLALTIGATPADAAQTKKPLRPLSAEESEIIKKAIEKKMIDPTSVLLDLPELPANIRPDAREFPYCGRVNGKNRLGGYAGFRPFAAILSFDGNRVTGVQRLDIEGPSDFPMLAELCTAMGYELEER